MFVRGITVTADQCGNAPTGALAVAAETEATGLYSYIAEPAEAIHVFAALAFIISDEGAQ